MASPFHVFLLTALLLTFYFSFTKSQGDERGIISSDPSYYFNLCGTSTCNNVSLPYPFSLPTFCHNSDMVPTCVDNQYLLLSIKQMSDTFRVIGNITSDSIRDAFFMASNSLFGCGQVTKPNNMVEPSIFSLPKEYRYGTHLNCTQYPTSAPRGSLQPSACLGCNATSGGNSCFYTPGFANYPGCESFAIFSKEGVNVSGIKDLSGYLRGGFQIRYSKMASCRGCDRSGGRCGSSPDGSFVCFCATSAHASNCSDGMAVDLRTWLPEGGKSKLSKAAIAAVCVSAVVVIALATLMVIIIVRRKIRREQDRENPSPDVISLDDLINSISSKRYKYSQLKKFTSNFSNKLGEGGFGSVYKGVIPEVGVVAIKILKISEQSEKQFMNEVATIGRVHHHNLVRLLGYCVHAKTRALVYEFMEKGSLDHYIYRAMIEGEENNTLFLTSKQIYSIAVETAKGILYLHEGCRSRILHCDIKPHNVLLDQNFSAKVADFGLAQMIDKDHSHLSLTNGQGTPGYAPPEMWTKLYGPITDKSDVYSYGMLLLEMVGGRKNYDMGVAQSSQVYFPEWLSKKVVNGDLKLRSHVSGLTETKKGDKEVDEEEVLLEKMCLVGLWCIQHIPSNRPSLSKVIQMLEGKVEIETPPPPFPDQESSGEITFTNCFTASSASSTY